MIVANIILTVYYLLYNNHFDYIVNVLDSSTTAINNRNMIIHIHAIAVCFALYGQ
jgi:hypothetical protein